jgi:hypothetical protein
LPEAVRSPFEAADTAVRRTNTDSALVEGFQFFSRADGLLLDHGAFLETLLPPDQVNRAVLLSPPAVVLKFPLRLGDTWESTSRFDVAVRIPFQGETTIESRAQSLFRVDGFGTVTLPSLGKLRCLRLNELRRTEVIGLGLLLDVLHTRSLSWLAEGLGEVARISSQTHSQLLGPPGIPGDSFAVAAAFEVQVTSSRSAPLLLRGDANGDEVINVSDAVFTLLALFVGGFGAPPCEDAADSNDDGALDVADSILPSGNVSTQSG